MNLREPAGRERRRGKSAELLVRARMRGGSVGNTCGTVCGTSPQGRYPLTGFSAHFVDERVKELSVGACLYRLFIWALRPENEKYGGHYNEIRTSARFRRRHDHALP